MRVAGIADPAGTARAMYRSLGRGLVELLSIAFRSPARRMSGAFPWARIESLAKRENGAVIATAHTGSWDLVACAVAERVPLTVVTKRLSVRPVNALWQRLRRGRGVRLAEVGGAAHAARGALGRGELVAMLVDQAPERVRGAVRVPFLGAPAWVDLAPALCALRARAPLVVAFPRRLTDGSHTVDIAAVLEPPRGPARREWAVEAMTEVTRLLEAFVRRHPEQWLWMHRRWKDAPAPALAERADRAPRLAGAGS
jgi:KDO2-lipid IV(A) lauroyltransferase